MESPDEEPRPEEEAVPGLIQSLVEEAKENSALGGGVGGLKSRMMSRTARLVLSSQVWRHAIPTTACDLLLTLPPGHPEAGALLTWLIDQIRRKERRLRMEVRYHEHTDTYGVYFSARYDTLLKGAELLQLKKRLKDSYGGGLRDFVYEEAECFVGVESKSAFLSSQERSLVVRSLLTGVRAKEGGEKLRSSDSERPPLFLLRPGQAVVAALTAKGFVADVQPLHEPEQLQALRDSWVASLQPQPIEAIKDYFGTQIGLYFSWLGHYTLALCIPASLGFFVWWWGISVSRSGSGSEKAELVSDLCFVGFALLNCLWGTVWIESWKRRQAELAYSWGTLGMEKDLLAEPRADYVGELRASPVTGRLEPESPAWKRRLIRYAFSYPIIAACIVVMMLIMMLIFKFQEWTDERFGASILLVSWLTFVPKILLGVVVFISDELFMKLARRLNDLENYRTDDAYDANLIVKICLFQFVNSFTALFYIAFWLQDMHRLSSQLAALLITRQVIGNIAEAGIPWLTERLRYSQMVYKMTRAMSDDTLARHVDEIKEAAARKSEDLLGCSDDESSRLSPSNSQVFASPSSSNETLNRSERTASFRRRNSARLPLPEFKPSGPQLTQAELESLLPKYSSPLEDYLEMFIQLGYVLLFSPAFPLAAAAALANNLLEIRVDAFKLCNTLQRPFARRVESIGVWMQAMELMGVAGVMVNCALIGQSGLVQRLWPDMSRPEQLLLVVLLEHLILGLKLIVSAAIPDIPNWVTVEMSKVEFKRREALKRETRLGGIGGPRESTDSSSPSEANGQTTSYLGRARRSQSAAKGHSSSPLPPAPQPRRRINVISPSTEL